MLSPEAAQHAQKPNGGATKVHTAAKSASPSPRFPAKFHCCLTLDMVAAVERLCRTQKFPPLTPSDIARQAIHEHLLARDAEYREANG